MSRVILSFANASCRHCVRVVTNSLQKIDGILSVQVDQIGGRVTISYDPSRVSIESIRSLMEMSGYKTRLLS